MSESFYLAAGYSGREDHAQLADLIEKYTGADCTSRWLRGGHDGMRPDAAAEGFADVRRAQTVVVVHGPSTRGGKWVELGLALAWGKPVILLVGQHVEPRPPVFASLEGVALVGSPGTAVVVDRGWLGCRSFLADVAAAHEDHVELFTPRAGGAA